MRIKRIFHKPSHTGFHTALYFTSVTESPPMQVHFQGQEVDAQQYRSLPVDTASGPSPRCWSPSPQAAPTPRCSNLAYVKLSTNREQSIQHLCFIPCMLSKHGVAGRPPGSSGPSGSRHWQGWFRCLWVRRWQRSGT